MTLFAAQKFADYNLEIGSVVSNHIPTDLNKLRDCSRKNNLDSNNNNDDDDDNNNTSVLSYRFFFYHSFTYCKYQIYRYANHYYFNYFTDHV